MALKGAGEKVSRQFIPIEINLRVFECYERLKIMRAENIIG